MPAARTSCVSQRIAARLNRASSSRRTARGSITTATSSWPSGLRSAVLQNSAKSSALLLIVWAAASPAAAQSVVETNKFDVEQAHVYVAEVQPHRPVRAPNG